MLLIFENFCRLLWGLGSVNSSVYNMPHARRYCFWACGGGGSGEGVFPVLPYSAHTHRLSQEGHGERVYTQADDDGMVGGAAEKGEEAWEEEDEEEGVGGQRGGGWGQ